ncbi:uroporphyrinogen-III C-methyltransferase [soil metagenome]
MTRGKGVRDFPPGTVYLVGAGPGDPGLLTLRAAQLLETAGAVFYDALVGDGVLRLISPEAERVFVGKRGGEPAISQEEINRRLVSAAARHRTVVRLKGGDPFVFGRGGEEALALAAASIPWEVVPGITAGVAAPAYAGVPVTHRGIASSVTLLTGHEDPAKETSDLDWERLAGGKGTLVFYMGLGRMADNFARLLGSGRNADTPAAVIENGTLPGQRTVTGTLRSLPALAEAANISAPALVVVGEVVGLRERLAPSRDRPLAGRRIVVTRARAQASALSDALRSLGAEVVEFPTIRIDDPVDGEPLRRGVRELSSYDWVVFTSVNGVDRFWSALRAEGGDARAFGRTRLCAIGPATQAKLKEHGLIADVVPDSFVAEALVAALRGSDLAGKRVLLPRAAAARDVLPRGLRELGATVDEVAAYRTIPDGSGGGGLEAELAADRIDVITFTASSTVQNWVKLVGTALGIAEVATIGPITSGTARDLGLPVHLEAEEYTIPGLVAALCARYTEGGG